MHKKAESAAIHAILGVHRGSIVLGDHLSGSRRRGREHTALIERVAAQRIDCTGEHVDDELLIVLFERDHPARIGVRVRNDVDVRDILVVGIGVFYVVAPVADGGNYHKARAPRTPRPTVADPGRFQPFRL